MAEGMQMLRGEWVGMKLRPKDEPHAMPGDREKVLTVVDVGLVCGKVPAVYLDDPTRTFNGWHDLTCLHRYFEAIDAVPEVPE